jgi:hypothetical protein
VRVPTAVDMLDSVAAQISQTRALDGLQDADWPSYELRWNYHPDDGLNVILTQKYRLGRSVT